MWVVNLDALAGPIIELLGMAGIAAALLAGVYLVLNGETHLFGIRMSERPLEAESLLQLYAFLAAIADPVRKLSSVYTRIQSGAAAADRIFFFLDRTPRVRGNSVDLQLPRHREEIEFQNVCFSYDPGHPHECEPDGTPRRNNCPGGTQRLRQDDLGEPAATLCRS